MLKQPSYSFYHLIMQLSAYLLFPSLLLISCGYDGRKNNDIQKLDSLINVEKDSLLFLSFWSGMSEQEFKSVVEMENRKANLFNGQFYFFIGNGEDSVGFKLEQLYDKKGIVLNYKDENWVKGDKYIGPHDYSLEGPSYQEIEKSLEKHFDDKYSLLDTRKTLYFNSKSWVINETFPRVVEMSWRYSIQSPTSSTWIFNPETSEYKVGDCNFNIRIMSLVDYEQNKFNYLQNEIARQAEEAEEKMKKEKEIKEKNNKL